MEFLTGPGGASGPEVMLFLAVPAGLLLVLVAIFAGGGERRSLSRRVDRVKVNHTAVSESAEVLNARRDNKSSSMPTIEELAKRFVPRQQVLKERLARAGMEISIGAYALACVFVGAFSFLLNSWFGIGASLASALIGVFVGIGLPHFFLSWRIGRRQTKFIAYFPEAIDLMVRGVKAGLPIAESIKTAGDEVPDPVGIELRRITDGVKMDEVLWETSRRLNLQEFNFFTIALSIQSETGGNLAETLNNLAEVLRGRRQLKRKVKALSSEAKASAYIIGSLPFIMCLMIYLVNDEYITKLFTDFRGQIMVGVGLTMIATGVGVMFKMVKFEI
jgi:tight adherence protein B